MKNEERSMMNKSRKLFFILHSSFFMFLWVGCSVKRESQLFTREDMNSVYRQTDSLQLQYASHEWGNKTIDIRHIEWLPPDSSNRQFVRTLTIIRAEDKKEEGSFSSLHTETDTKAIVETNSEVLNTERVEKKKKGPWLFLVIVGFFLAGAILLKLLKR
ncbi:MULTISPECIES: hypothetical protein [unclassified Parabacteroides]|uniref:hypothetical protein n=1 Tax=unclassified Parabacteroides TaxID=2649774 RepID=UPI00247372A8|nr:MULTISPECIES: hypothetical protein [unclassified Parabacteroides]